MNSRELVKQVKFVLRDEGYFYPKLVEEDLVNYCKQHRTWLTEDDHFRFVDKACKRMLMACLDDVKKGYEDFTVEVPSTDHIEGQESLEVYIDRWFCPKVILAFKERVLTAEVQLEEYKEHLKYISSYIKDNVVLDDD